MPPVARNSSRSPDDFGLNAPRAGGTASGPGRRKRRRSGSRRATRRARPVREAVRALNRRCAAGTAALATYGGRSSRRSGQLLARNRLAQESSGSEETLELGPVFVTRRPHLATFRSVQFGVVPQQAPGGGTATATGAAAGAPRGFGHRGSLPKGGRRAATGDAARRPFARPDGGCRTRRLSMTRLDVSLTRQSGIPFT
jgi:hypothetical protein